MPNARRTGKASEVLQMKRKTLSGGFAILLSLFLSLSAFGQTSLPNTFSEGQPALATEVNENFTALRDGLNAVEANDLIGLNPATLDGAVIAWEANQSTWINQTLSTQGVGGNQAFSVRGPYSTIHCIIALAGVYPSRSQSDPFIGQISWFGGSFAPRNWTFCDGQLLAINSNDALYSLLGTNFGGDGRTTFGVPDMRGRAPIHAGQGPGLSNYRLGDEGGSEWHLLNTLQLPFHSHPVIVSPEVVP